MVLSQADVDARIQEHARWLTDPKAFDDDRFIALPSEDFRGLRFNGANLARAHFAKANYIEADFSGCGLVRADFRSARLVGSRFLGADLKEAKFTGSILTDANFTQADLSRSGFEGADLVGACFCEAVLTGAVFSDVNARNANFQDADLSLTVFVDARLVDAYLIRANLIGARLVRTVLHGADFSGAQGLVDPATWLAEHFESDSKGVIVYKRIGWTIFAPPPHWCIEPGAVLTETVNPDRTEGCGCGVNFGTHAWCQNTLVHSSLWKCRIRWIDLAGVVVPYNTDGKARCARLELLECLSSGDS